MMSPFWWILLGIALGGVAVYVLIIIGFARHFMR